MKRIGILTCGNTAEQGRCASAGCLHALNENSDEFARYAKDGGAELVGIITCSGCPTALAPERILEKIKPLAELEADAIHLSSCMLGLCPFKNKYETIIKETFPDIDLVLGTHTVTPEDGKKFMTGMHQLLTKPRTSLVEIMYES